VGTDSSIVDLQKRFMLRVDVRLYPSVQEWPAAWNLTALFVENSSIKKHRSMRRCSIFEVSFNRTRGLYCLQLVHAH
jgi:hypothetical protein